MRTRLLGVLTVSGMLAAGAAFAADSTMPGSAAPAVSAPAASTSSSTTSTTTTTTKSDMMKMSHAGVVKSFDAKTHMLTLQDGSSFILDESLKGEDLKANDKVSFNYKTDGSHKIVTDYKIDAKL
jgi:hypothetical protein